jgi:hypothetical protein
LSIVYGAQGQYEKAAEITRQAMRIDQIRGLIPTRISPTTPLPCNASTKRGRSSTRHRRESWMIFHIPQCSLRSCLFRGGLRGDGGTATVVCRQARYENYGTCARIRHRGLRRSSGQGTGTDQAGCGLRNTSGQQGRCGNMAGECAAGSGLRQCLRKPGSQRQRL